jgi:hypothetical protein
VNVLRSEALNIVFLRVLYLTHFCLFHLLMISGVIHFCRFQIYADDLQTYHTFSVAYLQRCYDEVNAELKRGLMVLN